MYFFISFVFLFYFINGISSDETPPIVHTSLGSIQGSYFESYLGRKCKAFESVPYAQKPIGPLRFKPPKPVTKWNNILLATEPHVGCLRHRPKLGATSETIRGQEDCLYLNIYVPVTGKNELLPVLFTFPSGAFQYGSALSKQKFLMDKDMILVSHYYRSGIFGFLSTEDENIPGNMGLMDQSVALRWIFDHIKNFGGDPKRITLIGGSSAASSVHFHYLSPWSKGLFQNGISFSGTALSQGKVQKNSLVKFKKLGALLNCPTDNIPMTVNCLRNKPGLEILEKVPQFLYWQSQPLIPFGPVVDKASPKPFLSKPPIELLKSGAVADVLWITGNAKDEGLSPGAAFIEENLEELDQRWNKIAPHLLMYNFTAPYEVHDYLAETIRKKYLKKKKITKENSKTFMSLLGDALYCSSARRAAKLQAKRNRSPVLFWNYHYRAGVSCSQFLMYNPVDLGVCHYDDAFNILNTRDYPEDRPEDIAVNRKLMDIVYSVANDGYPKIGEGVEWERITSDDNQLEVLTFYNSKKIKMETKTEYCEYQFWDEIDPIMNQL